MVARSDRADDPTDAGKVAGQRDVHLLGRVCASAGSSSLAPRRGEGVGGQARQLAEGRHACWYWRSDADGNATWDPTSLPDQLPATAREARRGLGASSPGVPGHVSGCQPPG